jgi:hypothetical protein
MSSAGLLKTKKLKWYLGRMEKVKKKEINLLLNSQFLLFCFKLFLLLGSRDLPLQNILDLDEQFL